MNLFSSVDSLFASLFIAVTLVSVVMLTTHTVKLHKKDVYTVNNSIFSTGLIGTFFLLTMIPVIVFSLKEMPATAASIAVMAGVVSANLQVMANRGRKILHTVYGL